MLNTTPEITIHGAARSAGDLRPALDILDRTARHAVLALTVREPLNEQQSIQSKKKN